MFFITVKTSVADWDLFSLSAVVVEISSSSFFFSGSVSFLANQSFSNSIFLSKVKKINYKRKKERKKEEIELFNFGSENYESRIKFEKKKFDLYSLFFHPYVLFQFCWDSWIPSLRFDIRTIIPPTPAKLDLWQA